MELTTAEIVNLAQALVALDGREKCTDEGHVIREPYSFSGLARLSIASNLTECQRVVKIYQKARTDLIFELSGGKAELAAPSSFKKDEDKATAREVQASFLKQDALMLDTKHEVKLSRLAAKDLKLDTNPIPVTVLAALSPILTNNDDA